MIHNIPITDIFADETFNCREKLAPIDVHELAKNIQANGQLQAAIVRRTVPEDKIKEPYVLVAGCRRRYSCMVAGIPTLRCEIRDIKDKQEALLINLSENLNRKDLSIVEEGRALKKLQDTTGMTQNHIAEVVGRSTSWVNVRIRLNQLPPDIIKEISTGQFSQHHVFSLLRFPSGSEKQYSVFRAIKDQLNRGVNKTDIIVKKANENLAKQKRRRTPMEVGRMRMFLLNEIGDDLCCRLCAWVEGTVDNEAIFNDIVKYGKEIGKTVKIPKDFDLTSQ